jgi:hypothetical protein
MKSYKNNDPHPPIMMGTPPPAEWRIPFADWDRAPWNRWSFQNVRQILPTTAVRRGPGPVWALPESPVDIDAIPFSAVNGAPSTVAGMLNDTYTDGFLVMIDGQIIHESYHNGMTPHTLHLAQSVSKSVVATVAGILIGQGLLDPAAPITRYLPKLRRTAWKGATLQQVLDMTSGVSFDEEYTDPASDIGKTDVAAGWKMRPDDGNPETVWPESIYDQILSLTSQDADHGARFKYRSIETDVLAHAMERVSGLRLAELISQELWQKLGAEEDACFSVDKSGYALADGGFNATLRDFARFGQLHLQGGAREGLQIIPPEWVADIRSGDHGLFDDYGRVSFPNGRYRNQFWVEDAARQSVMARGVFGQLIYIAPEYGMVAVKLSTWPEFLNATHSANTMRALHAIAHHFGKT